MKYALLTLFALALTLATNGADLALASDGKTDYVVVRDPAAPVADRHAADELAAFLGQVTGATFEIVETGTAVDGPMLVVGAGAVQRQLAPELRLDNLKADGIVVETVGRHLIFAGDQPRGALYAVYTFLEDAVGCRWWSSKASTIPGKPTLTVAEQHVRYVPPLEYREPYFFDAFDGDYAVRNKCNSAQARLDESRGGKIVYGPTMCHTFDKLVPKATYAKEHPEYFCERDGVRIGRGQLCLTNPDVKRILAEQALAYLDTHPETTILSVSQLDTQLYCQCDACSKLAAAEGSQAGPLLVAVNGVAAEVAKRYPNVLVDTFAYQYTRKPPRRVRPAPNVIVRLCSVECDFATPLDSETNRRFMEDLKGWARICQRLYVWDYTANFNHIMMPYPNERILGPNVRLFVANNIKGIFEQNIFNCPGSDMAEMKAWMLAKLLWNPQLDDRELMEEFIAGYYGPAAPFILEYRDILHDRAIGTKTFLPITLSPSGAGYLAFDVMARAEQLFDAAETAVQDSPDLLNRVQVARLQIRYVWAMLWEEMHAAARQAGVPFPGPSDFMANLNTFWKVSKANAITMICGATAVARFHAELSRLGRTASPPPEGLVAGAFIDLQSASGLAGNPELAVLKHDELASDKVATRMPGSHDGWYYQQQLGIPEGRYSVYVSVRVEKTGNEGKAFGAGIYDFRAQRFVTKIEVPAADISRSGYVTYKVGTENLHNRSLLWAAPCSNAENIDAVWVDRFWLVKE